jgi:type I restriction enzyme S subunit
MTIYKRLGDYIREVNVRNRELKVTKLVGLTIDKAFIPSVANVIGTDLSNYKVIRREQFACSLMQVSRDGKMPIAMFEEDEAIISPAYPMFEVIDKTELLPQYLMMWFSRSEFDREASYYAVGGVRGSLTWEDFCNMTLPIPSIERQREIVEEYETLTKRIHLNEQMIQYLEATAQALYRKMFVNNIDKENLPVGWRMGALGEVAQYVEEKISLADIEESVYIATENMLKDKQGIVISTNKPDEGRGTYFQIDDVLVSNIRPYFKKIWRASFCGASSNDVLCFRAKDIFNASMLFYTLEQDVFFDYVMAGSNGVKMPRGDKEWIMKYPLLIPPKQDIAQYQEITDNIRKQIICRKEENSKLAELQSLLLAKMGQ